MKNIRIKVCFVFKHERYEKCIRNFNLKIFVGETIHKRKWDGNIKVGLTQ